ncbi:MAG: hypothetical protein OEZ32_03860 [Nitrospinota bacterium]|nr:hypothetical protein [Nitrospinota bacterium]
MLAQIAVNSVPRALGLCDRDKHSPTYGCVDRAYWNYRTTDMANARMQEGGLLFAMAWRQTGVGANMFAGKKVMDEWARAAWRFWLSRRNGDGSVNEVYPFERSFCATSFSAAAFVETLLLAGGAKEWEKEITQARNTMEWLCENRNPDVANQMAASALALKGYSVITGDRRFLLAAERRRDEVLKSAYEDGIFGEYGGLDVGYQTITMSSMARYMVIGGGDTAVEEALMKGEKLVNERLDEMGRPDSAQNSRNTQFVYPYALALLKSDSMERIMAGLKVSASLNPAWMDDRYFTPLAIDYIFAEACL